MKKKALIILAEGFEEIEAITCIDVLRRADIKVIVAGLKKLFITGSHAITIVADIRLEDYKGSPDAIILPGGMPGAVNLANSAKVISLIKDCFLKNRIVAAICAAPAFVLFSSGILKAKKVTCYPGYEKRLKDVIFVKKPVVIDGNIITSQGPATAIDFAFSIAKHLVGKREVSIVKKRMLAT